MITYYNLEEMVSTGKLRLVSELSNESIKHFSPTISDEGQVTYPEAEELLNQQDGTSVEALNSLAEKGLFTKEYTSKVYVCPSCHVEGLQYITACPSCEDTHTIHTTFFEHESCGHTAESQQFETEESMDTLYCPNCDVAVDSSELAITQRHLCNECGKSFEQLSHRLWCLDCLHLCQPEKAIEQTLYEYELTEEGEQWYEVQTEARKLFVDEFDTRGFDVSLDVELQTDDDSDEPYEVHLYATDELLNQRIVADVHSVATSEKLQYISTAAEEVQAQPVLLLIGDSMPDDLLQIANQYGVTILWVDQHDSIRRYESVDDEYRPTGNIIDRLSSAVGFKSAEKG